MRILYGTDGSEGAVSAGCFMAGLLHHRDIHVHIVAVLENGVHKIGDLDDGENILSVARSALGAFPGHITTGTTRGDSTGEIVESLLFTAAYVKADLIVLGASGRSRIDRFFLGSVSEAVARHSDLPVLVTRPLKGTLCEVLVGVDGSEKARQAACWAVGKLPLPASCTIHLVRSVTPPVWVWEAQPSALTILESEGELAQAIRDGIVTTNAYLEPLAKELADVCGHTITTEVTVGNPAEELVRIASERKADLIVVGSQGLSGIRKFLLGSISEKVLRHANCSVLVVR